MRTKPVLCGMSWTPKTLDELDEFIERYSGEEKILVAMAVAVSWNCCAKLAEKKS